MQFEYVLQYREAAEARAYRFAGDAPARTAIGPALLVRLLGWLAFFVTASLLLLLLSGSGAFRGPGRLSAALAEPDRIDHPVFVIGMVLCAIGAAMLVVPLTYLSARRRSARPAFDVPVTFEIGDAGITLRTAARQTLVRWDGIVAFGRTPRLLVLKTPGDLRPVLPLRCVPSPEVLKVVLDELRRRVPPMARALGAPGMAA